MAPLPQPQSGQPHHTTETNHLVLYKIRRILFTTARGRGRVHSRQQHSYSCFHPTLMGTQEPTPVSGTSLLRDQECPAHVALPKQPEAQDGCEVPAVPPSAGTLFSPAAPPPLCPGQGTARSLLCWHRHKTQLSPPGPQTRGKPLAFLSSSSLVRDRAPSALFSSTAQPRTSSSRFCSTRERSCHSLVPDLCEGSPVQLLALTAPQEGLRSS